MKHHRDGVLEPDHRGGTVTAVEAQRRRGRVNVYLDDCFAISLAGIVAERACLRPGLRLSGLDVARLAEEDAAQVALDCALGYLSYRPRSEREMRQNLVRRGLGAERIEQVVSKLKELKLLDDTAFAQFWVENRDRFSPRGAYALRSELFGKGLARETVDEATGGERDEAGRARNFAEKKIAGLSGLEYHTYYRRMVGMLVRRGFSYEIAGTVAKDLWPSAHEGVEESTRP